VDARIGGDDKDAAKFGIAQENITIATPPVLRDNKQIIKQVIVKVPENSRPRAERIPVTDEPEACALFDVDCRNAVCCGLEGSFIGEHLEVFGEGVLWFRTGDGQKCQRAENERYKYDVKWALRHVALLSGTSRSTAHRPENYRIL